MQKKRKENEKNEEKGEQLQFFSFPFLFSFLQVFFALVCEIRSQPNCGIVARRPNVLLEQDIHQFVAREL
jgi:hypothetical protein